DVEEAVLLETDLDERRLHAREHVVDDAEVDVPGDRAALGTLEVDLGDAVVLEDRDPLLAHVDGDDELPLRGGERRPLRRRPAARSISRLASLRLPVGFGCALRARPRSARRSRDRLFRLDLGRNYRVSRDRLLPAPSAAGA